MASAIAGSSSPQLEVGHGGALFDVGQGADQLREEAEPHTADVEVLHRAHGLHAEIILRRDFHLTQQIVLTTGLAREFDVCKVHGRNVFYKGTKMRSGYYTKYSAFSVTLL